MGDLLTRQMIRQGSAHWLASLPLGTISLIGVRGHRREVRLERRLRPR
jgi:hypothetical protein